MLSSLPKGLADRNFVIGFLLPILIAGFAALAIFPDVPWIAAIRVKISSDKLFEDLTYVVAGAWVLAVLLFTVNYFWYRLLEGYLPPLSWFTSLQAFHRRKLEAMLAREKDSIEAWKRERERYPLKKQTELAAMKSERLATYPSEPNDVLPTLFGNAIRAFEVYPRDVYGADGISLWTRLPSVISKDFSAAIDSARSPVDFYANLCLLALVLGAGVCARFVYLAVSGLPTDVPYEALVVALCLLVAYGAYRSATLNVAAWGDLIKSAFDCYLPALASQMGYALPATESLRRAFWTDVSRQVLYRELIADGTWAAAASNAGERAGSGRSNAAERNETVDTGDDDAGKASPDSDDDVPTAKI